ncbi:DUF3850 domain-containing protein [Candidatus Woesearchaeota archaeon]|nr:DUF3850 domain-containing protein [Candidatus Woesearchaeota archaeon]
MKIEKKVWPPYFEEISTGEKTFELRLADWECERGDILILKEYDPGKKQYTGRVIEKKVGFVGKVKLPKLLFWSVEEVEKYGLQIISLK